jgi:DNA-binding NtrC family response regulator
MATILLVEQSAHTRKQIADWLKTGGHHVIAFAADSASAVKIYQQLSPLITLMNVIIPGESGFNTCNRILNVTPSALVVLYCSIASDYYASRAFLNGAVDYLHFPFTQDILLQAVSHAELVEGKNKTVRRLRVRPADVKTENRK